MSRYVPSRHFLQAGLAAILLGAFTAWCGRSWMPAYAAVALFLATAAVLLFALASRPPIEIQEAYLVIGRRGIPWADIRRVDHTGWLSPLVVRLTLADQSRILLIYPGDIDSGNSLLHHLRRYPRQALIDGHPYRKFWNEELPLASEGRPLASPKYRLLLPEDEAEVERLYQRLKAVRRLDPDNSADEE
ncbi:MAG: hypothetical protein ABSH46_15235 [Bryobacteraceae bacterium]